MLPFEQVCQVHPEAHHANFAFVCGFAIEQVLRKGIKEKKEETAYLSMKRVKKSRCAEET